MTDRPKFVSVFSGAGGLDIGLETAGWQCVYASDVDPAAVRTLASNQRRALAEGVRFLDECYVEQKDIRHLEVADIARATGFARGSVELLAGGPPCQAWSSAGLQRGFEDERGAVAREFVRLAGQLQTRWLLMENVRGLLTARDSAGEPGGALRHLRAALLTIGYQTSVQLLNAADFGVPQRRVRLFVVGFRPGDEPPFPHPTHARFLPNTLGLGHPWVTLGEALAYLAPPSPDEIQRPSPALEAELSKLPPGSGLKSPGKPEATRPGGHWGYTQGAFVADPGLPARTITASAQQDWIRDPVWGLRRLAPRECAAVQTFPPGWQLPGNRNAAYRLIGNAVPPRLAEALGRQLLDRLQDAHPSVEIETHLTPQPLPRRLHAAIDYTIKEERRNGASRRAAPSKRRSQSSGNPLPW